MTVVILGEAERESAESVAYCEAKETGLGWRFRTEVVEAVDWIESEAAPSETRRDTGVAICRHFHITSPTSFAMRPSGLSRSHRSPASGILARSNVRLTSDSRRGLEFTPPPSTGAAPRI